jgi:hypothetical protein
MAKTPVSETPTDEQLSHWGANVREEHVSPIAGSPKRHRNQASCEIDRLYLLGHLTQDEHTTLEMFSKDLYDNGMVFCPKAGLVQSGTSGHAQFIGDAAFSKAKRLSLQMEALRGVMTDGARMVVISVLTQDTKLSGRKIELMSAAAEALAPLYEPRVMRRVS